MTGSDAFGDPDCVANRLANILVVVTLHPVGTARAVWSSDGFVSAEGTAELFSPGAQLEFIQPLPGADITLNVADGIVRAWRTQEAAWARAKSRSRLCTALMYFYHAWRSHYAEQMCLNLAVVLEVLFAPHSQSETTHQIAYNVARHIGGGVSEQERVYRFVREFYSARSTIVHGGVPDNTRVVRIVREAFPFVGGILREILVRDGEAEVFDNDSLRQKRLQALLFGTGRVG